ncbi:hypothetical protein JCM3765_004673 [Sporobolomyces pararoseus]
MATRRRVPSKFSEPSTLSSSFYTKKDDKQFSQQYANLYWLRLVVLRNRLLEKAKTKWQGNGKIQGVSTPPEHVSRLLEVKNGQLCYVLGTLYVDMPLKPNVLEDLARDHHITAPPSREKYYSKSDEIMLEDESGRVRLVGSKILENSGKFVTGTIVACLGAETSSGDFEVFEYLYCGMPDQPNVTNNTTTSQDADKEEDDDEGEWIGLVSGLEMGNHQQVGDLRTELMAEWLNGELGLEDDDDSDREEAIKVSRLILCGNSLAQPDLTLIDDNKKKRYGYDSSLYSSKPTLALDQFLSQLCTTLPVDLMPGEKDPTAPTMPQQSLHPALLPLAAGWENFNGRTNPWWFQVRNTTFLGTCGQTIDDIFKYLESQDRLEIAQQTLEWSHIAPTCPDTLWCYPFTDRDPFILEQTPHVYFIGNQPKFESKLIERDDDGKKVRIILVPKFSKTGQLVLVNSKTLNVKVVTFEA